MKRDPRGVKLRQDARAILNVALIAADPTVAVEQALRHRDFSAYNRIFVVGAGKASGTMARVVEEHLGPRIAAGCVNVKDGDTALSGQATKPTLIELRPASHPIPDERGLAGSRRIAEICAAAEENDLVLCLLSGGASALMPSPAPPVTLQEKQEATRLLLACGAGIHEINAVRKHLSSIKGGQLARMAAPARVLSLIRFEGKEHLDAVGNQAVIVLVPHFVGMDVGWTRLSCERPLAAIYARQKNDYFEKVLLRGRIRFSDGVHLRREDGFRPAIRAMREGMPLYYLPDMDFGDQQVVFVPFFGQPAATITAVSRLARTSKAKVIPCVSRVLDGGAG